jgi:hypothetical protein
MATICLADARHLLRRNPHNPIISGPGHIVPETHACTAQLKGECAFLFFAVCPLLHDQCEGDTPVKMWLGPELGSLRFIVAILVSWALWVYGVET